MHPPPAPRCSKIFGGVRCKGRAVQGLKTKSCSIKKNAIHTIHIYEISKKHAIYGTEYPHGEGDSSSMARCVKTTAERDNHRCLCMPLGSKAISNTQAMGHSSHTT
ncbi:unnamed protein product [Ectocarpus sp. 4 AP-2014]